MSAPTPDIIGITVSTKYAKKLDYIATHNAPFFKQWYVVTAEADEETRAVCAKYPNITPIFHKFDNGLSVFDKGGALRKAQLIAHAAHPTAYMCIIDSDIVLPADFLSVITPYFPLKDTTLYGAWERRDFTAMSDMRRGWNFTIHKMSKACIGFLTLYKPSDKYLYRQSYTCAECDMKFKDLFEHREPMKYLVVNHLGIEGVNWYGIKAEDFRWD